MRRPWHMQIRTKLVVLASLVSAMALLLAGVALTIIDYRSGRATMLERLHTQAEIIALNSAAALAFDDEQAAERTLAALAAEKAALAAAIRRPDGSELARVAFVDTTSHAPGFVGEDGARVDDDHVHVVVPVVLDEPIGSVYLCATSRELHDALWNKLAILIATMLAALAAAALAASRLQRPISEPILELAQMASSVSRNADYTLRAEKRGDDEVGQLVDAFNDMLGQIEARDERLRRHQSELETKVAERTAELARALNDAQAAARAKADFLANMSHEIRTPMNGVIGMLDLIDGSCLDAEHRGMLNTARHSANMLLTLINDVLDFSKIDAGKLTLERIDVPLRTVAEEVVTLFARQAHVKGVELTCLVHNDVPAVVQSDPTRLRQILSNLIGNAVKFTEQGEICLSIAARAVSGDEAAIELEVRDTGIGIPAETLPRLFQAFTQADSSTTRRYGGTGLGLAITKRLVDAMNGTITVDSEPGRGTTFRVTLPMTVASRTVPSTRPADLHGLTALIVDDNATNRLILQHHLAAWDVRGQETDSAAAGLAALRAAAASGRPFDLVLLDYQMPEVDGAGFLREMREDAAIADTPCIVLSSAGDRMPDAEGLGVAAWLTKPVRQAELYSTLAHVAGQACEADKASGTSGDSGRISYDARVLLVEDNQINREVATRVLATFGIMPDVANDGALALARIRSTRYDLVFMDCQMPVMDGYEATMAIRELEYRQGRPRVPVIAMTANAMPGDRERCLAAGMDDYVPKPIKRDVVGEALMRWIPDRAVFNATQPVVVAPPAAANAPADQAVDRAPLEQLRELFHDDLPVIIDTYFADSVQQLGAIEAAIWRKDYATLTRNAHSLKSSSMSVGARALGELAAKLEALGRAKGSLTDAAQLHKALGALLRQTEPELRAAV